ncbi:MAG TPA: hypothetical protein VMW80_13690 [Candidatus Dormibacteraeota bacterium]|nr:hypothetical protein [Candidatus Dormibacteraeota bacterium]
MSRELGWKQFQTDDPHSANSPDGSPAPSYLGLGVRAPLPWADVPAPVAPDSAPTATTPAAPATPVSPKAKGPVGSQRSLRLGEAIWLGLAVVDGFLAVDFLLRALAASGTGIVGLVTRVGNVLAAPFFGVFNRPGVPKVDHTTFWAALVAIVIYTLAAWILIRLLRLVVAPAPQRVPPS